MFIEIISNPIIVLIAGLALMFICAKIIAKPDKKSKSNKKVEKAIQKEEKSEEKINDENSTPVIIEPKKDDAEETLETVETAEGDEDNKNSKKRKKPEITRVFDRTKDGNQKSVSGVLDEKDALEEELLKKMQFVKTSKTVSKLAKIDESLENETFENQVQENTEVLADSEQGKNTSVVKNEVKHFDRSRRLSKCIKCDALDELFVSHLSEHYLNMDENRHLKIDNIKDSLFDRAIRMLANSGGRVVAKNEDNVDEKIPDVNNKESMKEWIESQRRIEQARFLIETSDNSAKTYEEVAAELDGLDIGLDLKSILVSDTIMNRKKPKNS